VINDVILFKLCKIAMRNAAIRSLLQTKITPNIVLMAWLMYQISYLETLWCSTIMRINRK
jgi:hypothetical protein